MQRTFQSHEHRSVGMKALAKNQFNFSIFKVLQVLNYPWISGIKPILSWLMFFFDVLLDSVCKQFIENNCICVHKETLSTILFIEFTFTWYQDSWSLVKCVVHLDCLVGMLLSYFQMSHYYWSLIESVSRY